MLKLFFITGTETFHRKSVGKRQDRRTYLAKILIQPFASHGSKPLIKMMKLWRFSDGIDCSWSIFLNNLAIELATTLLGQMNAIKPLNYTNTQMRPRKLLQ